MTITSVQLPSSTPDIGYLLVEPSNLSTEILEVLPAMHACVPSFLWAAEASMPRLLRLDQLSQLQQESISQLLQQEASEQHPPAVCGWLQADKSIEELANCVARLIAGQGPDGRTVIWRYYDPRVFVLTAHLFTDEQRHALLGVIESWTFPWHRQWWRIQRERPFVPSTADLDLGWPTSSQWELLGRSRLFRQIHSRLNDETLSPVQCLDDLSHSIKVFIESANYIHLDSDEDRAEFTFLSTHYREIFHSHHELLTAWDQLRNREITLQEMLSVIKPQDIEYMESKLNDLRRYA
jgi:hypothetical protein